MPIDATKEMYDKVQTFHDEMYNFLVELIENGVKGLKPSQLTDIGFLLREMENIVKDVKVDIQARRQVFDKILIREHLNDPAMVNAENAETVVHGMLARAAMAMESIPELPKFGTPEYLRFMTSMGVDTKNLDIIKPSYGGLSKRLNEHLTTGTKLPEGIVGRPNFTVVYTRKKAQ